MGFGHLHLLVPLKRALATNGIARLLHIRIGCIGGTTKNTPWIQPGSGVLAGQEKGGEKRSGILDQE